MRAYDIILKKRAGKELTKAELEYLISGYVSGEIPDYQLAAWAMAVFFQGMKKQEVAALTSVMADSGEQLDLSSIAGVKVDKHSTGGVGDSVTLVLAPLVAAAGVPVAKMSGRGLGHTGGTIDKLEAIPNFRTALAKQEFIDNVNRLQVAVAGQTANLAPADKKLYALRDVTATVDSIPLIASSIMSKKIAAGADKILLDVKVGNGAFMKELAEAEELARTMVEIGNNLGQETVAVISDMNQPLGKAVGNALEVKEAIETLRGEGPADLEELSLCLGAEMLKLAGRVENTKEGKAKLRELLASGAALEKFKELIRAQGGQEEVVDNPNLLATSKKRVEIKAPKSGYITEILAEEVGLAAMLLGAGRENKEATIDLAVGIVLEAKLGAKISKGDKLATLHVNEDSQLAIAKEKLENAYKIEAEQLVARNLVHQVIN
ncbi:pyrimidine-nucleoside phosphorylase [Fuchsiella alkaliacetigena]|uniref:pyrimidine-nucleoside phosphorylase n=1 Tax=Fuchsiella alkaliacetigena TaxID=957042 RepID=UPI00200B303F|nr:pyrimidine-nucleoside phosphorylase [Fuchsiella alkaliacetigena]MCK8824759.1 pyrimidine-nucleoside phosphorylase [Fuchsiella alkaliacetigena]